jgi:putative tryptophan/tyrosine transport system substrate-binding protein
MAAAITGVSALWTPAARAAKQAKSAIPIVAIVMADPVADDLVASLAEPGGNVTGTTFLGPELVAKRLQLLKEVVPGSPRGGPLASHAYSERTMAGLVKEVQVTARTLGMQLQLAAANSPDEIAGAFATVIRERAEALIVLPSPMLFGECTRMVNIAVNSRLPAIGTAREFADAGGLMSRFSPIDGVPSATPACEPDPLLEAEHMGRNHHSGWTSPKRSALRSEAAFGLAGAQ